MKLSHAWPSALTFVVLPPIFSIHFCSNWTDPSQAHDPTERDYFLREPWLGANAVGSFGDFVQIFQKKPLLIHDSSARTILALCSVLLATFVDSSCVGNSLVIGITTNNDNDSCCIDLLASCHANLSGRCTIHPVKCESETGSVVAIAQHLNESLCACRFQTLFFCKLKEQKPKSVKFSLQTKIEERNCQNFVFVFAKAVDSNCNLSVCISKILIGIVSWVQRFRFQPSIDKIFFKTHVMHDLLACNSH